MRNKDDTDNRTAKRKLGDIGENCACEFLLRRGYEILERNYLRKWGELDIVAKKAGKIHFVEVKSVSREKSIANGSQETSDNRQDVYRPEENLHPGKLRRLARTMELYMLHKKLNCDWQLDLITAKIDLQSREARVEMIENIVI